jgi:3-hydroxybutyryl-CoA dehydratase
MKTGDQYNHEFVVSEELYNGFIHLFKDHNPLHTDQAFASSKGFQDKVMHGNILNGFVSFFVGELLPVKDVIIMQQEIKFPAPVYMNDVLQFSAVLKEEFESVNALEFSFNFKNAEKKTVAKGKLLIGII